MKAPQVGVQIADRLEYLVPDWCLLILQAYLLVNTTGLPCVSILTRGYSHMFQLILYLLTNSHTVHIPDTYTYCARKHVIVHEFISLHLSLPLSYTDTNAVSCSTHLSGSVFWRRILKSQVMMVCVLNRIPIFAVGKPGNSKSLSLRILNTNLRGTDSEEELDAEWTGGRFR